MDHGVINSQSHMMVWMYLSVSFYNNLLLTVVPGSVGFMAQVQLTYIIVTWQV